MEIEYQENVDVIMIVLFYGFLLAVGLMVLLLFPKGWI